MKKSLFFSSLLTLILGSSLSGYFTSDVFKEEFHNNAHFVCNVEPEIENIYAHKCVTPNDNQYSKQKQYSMNTLGDIENTWNNYTGKGTTIAIIDDGFGYNHPEYVRSDGSSAILSTSRYYYSSSGSAYYKSYSTNPSCIDEDWDLAYKEWATHGTNTSTTAAAPMGNNGIVGIAPDADILALKVDMSFAALKAAISYAIDQKVDVINMSLGAYAESFTDGFNESHSASSVVATYLDSVCKEAYEKGIIVVAAAGNEATSYKSYPACNSHVIGVGALAKNSTTKLAAFTNFNKSEDQGDEKNVDILAPGFVWAAGCYGSSSASYNHDYDDTQGTSFSSPIVAGAACLWKEKFPNGTPEQFEKDLTSSAAGIGTYKNATVNPATYYSNSDYKDNLDSNISCGRLDIGSLLSFSHDATGISISESSHNLYTSDTSTSNISFNLSASVIPDYADEKTINWTTSNSNVATISNSTSNSGENIVVTAGTIVGATTITAKTSDGKFTATCLVTTSKYIPVTNFSIVDTFGNNSGKVEKGKTIQLDFEILPANATCQDIAFDSDNAAIATVNDSGLITGTGVGTTTIYAYCGNELIEASYNVEVTASSVNSFLINFYNSDSISESSSQVAWSLNDFNNEENSIVSMDGVINSDIVTNVSTTNAYKRKGGCSLGTNKNSGNIVITFDSNYLVNKVTVVGANWSSSSSSLTLKDYTSSGSLNNYGTLLENCTSKLVWSDLNNISSLTFSSSSRAVIYTIECEFTYASSSTVSLESIEVSNAKNNYIVGDTFVKPVVTAYYSDDSSKNVTSLATFSGYNLNTAGTQTVNVSYEENLVKKETSYTINVSSEDDEVATYYSSITATSGKGLLGQLHTLMANTHSYYSSYSDCQNADKVYLTDPGSSSSYVTDFYTQKDIGRAWGSGDTGTWNREHVWCQSLSVSGSTGTQLYGTTYGGSDLHHIRPVESTLNSTRNNHPYGELSDFGKSRTGNERKSKDTNGNLINDNIGGYYMNGLDVFEPIDSVKGDVARIVMYVYMHYSSETSGIDSGTSLYGHTTDLVISNIVTTPSNNENSSWSKLLSWSNSDPVSESEKLRNEAIYAIQGNRNPFIDHPEYANAIWGNTDYKLTSISVSGQKTSFFTGEDFSFGGTVTANYSNGSSNDVTSLASFSGFVKNQIGDQNIVVSYSESGITKSTTYKINVSLATESTITINRDSFNTGSSSGYGWYSFTSQTISGSGYMYATLKTAIQFSNNDKPGNTIFSTTQVGYIKSIKIVTAQSYTEKNWTLYLSNSQYSQSNYETGTNYGQNKALHSTGYTWNIVDDNFKYFSLVLTDSTKGASYISEIVVKYSTVPNEVVPKITGLTLDKNIQNIDLYQGSTFTLTPTVTYNGDIDTTIAWSSSNDSIASVSTTSTDKDTSITITCYKTGSVTIKAACGDKEASCVVTITDSTNYYTLKSLELVVPDNQKTLKYKDGGGSVTINAILNAIYMDDHKSSVTPTSSNFVVDTNSIGDFTISASYGGLTTEAKIKITNVDSSSNLLTESNDLLDVNSTGVAGSYGKINKELDNSSYEMYAMKNNGIQMNTNRNSSIVQTISGGKVNSISFDFYDIKNGVEIFGKNTAYSSYNDLYDEEKRGTKITEISASNLTTSVSKELSLFEATSGKITINLNNEYSYIGIKPKSGAVNITSISFNYKNDVTLIAEEQAVSYSNYFLNMTTPICSGHENDDNTSSLVEIWSTLQKEFTSMLSESKDAFLTSQNITIVSARERYQHIVSKYSNFTNYANASVSRSSYSLFNLVNNTNNSDIVILVIGFASSLSLITYFINKKRKTY